jgi:hypothetical protein
MRIMTAAEHTHPVEWADGPDAQALKGLKEMEEERQVIRPSGARHGYQTTAGGEVYVEDREIVTVTSVMTKKHGPCLILRVRDGEQIWIVDGERARMQLRLGSPPEIIRNRGRILRDGSEPVEDESA